MHVRFSLLHNLFLKPGADQIQMTPFIDFQHGPTSRTSPGLMPPTMKTSTAVHSDKLAALGATAPAGKR